jgi:restriction system protein
MSIRSWFKGWMGEIQGTLAKKIFLDSSIYIDINNVTIPTENGTTQIDHVIISRYGLFVVETKNMNGWIFGDEKSPQWMQQFFDKKYPFQNPLHQNYRHTKALSAFLDVEHHKLFSIVMFWGNCEFKTPLPKNVMKSGYISYIKSHTQVLFSDAEVRYMVATLKSGMLPKSWATRRAHIATLEKRFSNPNICPKCGHALVLRTAKRGHHAGSPFYGCSHYPQCRYIKPL